MARQQLYGLGSGLVQLDDASTSQEGIVRLATIAETTAGTATDLACTPAGVAAVAIAGAPDATEATKGILQLSTQAEALAGADDSTAMTPLKVAQVLQAGGAGVFSSLTVSGLSTLQGSADISTAGTTLNLGTDDSGDDVNVALGTVARDVHIADSAAAHTVTIGSTNGAAALTLHSGTGSINMASTGTGNIIIDSDNTLLLDADGVLELNSSAGVISIGNDADSQNINIGTAGARTIQIGNSTGATGLDLFAGTDGVDIGTNAVAQTITIGNATGATSVVINAGTGPVNIGTNAVAHTTTVGSTTGVAATTLQAGSGAMTFTAGGIFDANVTGAVTVDTLAGISLDGATASNFTVTGASADLTLSSAGGSVNVVATEAAADAIRVNASAGAGGIDVDAGSAGIAIDTTGALSLDSAATSNYTVTGAGADLNLMSVGGSVLVDSTENVALAIRLHANGGTSETIQVHADQGTGVASIGLLSDVGGITLRSTGLASNDAINLEAAAGGIDVDAALQINVATSETNANSMVFTSAGGIDITATGGAAKDLDLACTNGSITIVAGENAPDSIVISSTIGGIDITAVGASAGEDIDITATGSSINITATEAAANAIVLSASNAAGGIDLTTGGGSIDLSSAGSVTMVAGTDSQAGATCTVNKNAFAATFTGFTTASAASQVFNITNSIVTTSSQVLGLTLCNEGANDAQMTITRVKRTAGQLQVTAKNNGAAALNGDVTITGWIIG